MGSSGSPPPSLGNNALAKGQSEKQTHFYPGSSMPLEISSVDNEISTSVQFSHITSHTCDTIKYVGHNVLATIWSVIMPQQPF